MTAPATSSIPSDSTEPLAHVLVISGASGSGKTRLARTLCQRHGWPFINLDDFYRDGDEPELPRFASREIDWDDPRAWNASDAVAALTTLCRTGDVNAPLYSISASRRSGTHRVRLGGARYVVAEGIFAPHVIAALDEAGVLARAWYLNRPRTVNAARRFIRDMAERRKPPAVLIRRGFRLWRQEPMLRAHHEQLGAHPVEFRRAQKVARQLAENH